jgi:hypothetical protein
MAIDVRLPISAIETIDDWRRRQDDRPRRPEAIRRFVEQGLKAKQPGAFPGEVETGSP